jgi:hypothetical protein
MPWFDRLFGKSKPSPPAPSPQASAASTASAASPNPDEIARARVASGLVLTTVMQALKDDRGIHLESLYCALGAMAGCACQASVRAEAVAAGEPPDSRFEFATTPDGKRYLFGDALNRPLAENRLSVWSLVAGAAAHDGAKDLPDLVEVFKHNASVLGGDAFGMPRIPIQHPLHDLPINYARKLWPQVQAVLVRELPRPGLWPVAMGLTIQELMAKTRGNVPPEIIARIVIESAIPVSKVPLGN